MVTAMPPESAGAVKNKKLQGGREEENNPQNT
jgi:hypothetical protein